MSWTDAAGTVRTVSFTCTCGCEFEPPTPPGGPLANTQYFCPRCGRYCATYAPVGPQPGESPEVLELHRARGWRESADGGWTIDPELAAAYASSLVTDRASQDELEADADASTQVIEALSLQKIRCRTAALELWARVYAVEYELGARDPDCITPDERSAPARNAADASLLEFVECIRSAPV